MVFIIKFLCLVGGVLLVYEIIDWIKEDCFVWIYNVGICRVWCVFLVGYDNFVFSVDNLLIVDDVDMFNGVLDCYDWWFVGK